MSGRATCFVGSGTKSVRSPRKAKAGPRTRPLPVGEGGLPPRSAEGIVVFGGTFDPPHRWHTLAAAAARRRLCPRGWVLFVPAARSPLKSHGPVAPDADRVAMLRLASSRMVRTAIWTGELSRRGPSYTIDTLVRLRRRFPRVPMRLLMGADQAADFHRWRRFREVMRLADPVVVLRPPISSAAALRRALGRAGMWTEGEVEEWVGRVVPCRVGGVSSTGLRRSLARGEGAGVDPRVRTYALRRGLYRPGMVTASPTPRP